MKLIEEITFEGRVLAYIIPNTSSPERTIFLTAPEDIQQVGFVVYASGGEIMRHIHKKLKRAIQGTSEVLVVRSGLCEVDVYSEDKQLVATKTLGSGDVLVLVAGGHGFRMLRDTIFLEVKQGPYIGVDEKERF